jgi:hypothetical protein
MGRLRQINCPPSCGYFDSDEPRLDILHPKMPSIFLNLALQMMKPADYVGFIAYLSIELLRFLWRVALHLAVLHLP